MANRNRLDLAIETSPDQLDQIQYASERDLAIGGLQRNSDLLRNIRDALRRIDASAFGVCLGCNENISPRRLAAVPWASLCIGCQEAADREQEASEGDIDIPIGMVA
jgi:DnaK suppressor protein